MPDDRQDGQDRSQGRYKDNAPRPRHIVAEERIPFKVVIDEARMDDHMGLATDQSVKSNAATEDEMRRFGKPPERTSKSKEVRARGDNFSRKDKVEKSSEQTKLLARDLDKARSQVYQLTTDNAAKDSTIDDLRNRLAAKDREVAGMTKSGDLTKQRILTLESCSLNQTKEIDALKESLDRTRRLLDTRNSELQSAETFLDRADSMPGAEVVKMVDALNLEIFQTAALMADAFVELDQKILKEGPTPEFLDARGRISSVLGDPMVRLLLTTQGEDSVLLLQIVFQVILVVQSSRIIQSWSLTDTYLDQALCRIYSTMHHTGE